MKRLTKKHAAKCLGIPRGNVEKRKRWNRDTMIVTYNEGQFKGATFTWNQNKKKWLVSHL